MIRRSRKLPLALVASLTTAVLGLPSLPSNAVAGAETQSRGEPVATYDGNFDVLVMGDSFSAGNGGGDYYGPKKCYRSSNNYGEQFARHLARRLNQLTPSVVTAACSGAESRHITERWEQKDQPPQVSLISSNTDLVLLTLGGNDAGFTPVVQNCLIDATRDAKDCDGALDRAEHLIFSGEIKSNISSALQAIDAKLSDHAGIGLLGYPHLEGDSTFRIRNGRVRKRDWVDVGSRLRALQEEADRVQRSIIDELGRADRFKFFSVQELFDGPPFHGLYADGRSAPDAWLVKAKSTISTATFYHPNPTGWDREGQLLAEDPWVNAAYSRITGEGAPDGPSSGPFETLDSRTFVALSGNGRFLLTRIVGSDRQEITNLSTGETRALPSVDIDVDADGRVDLTANGGSNKIANDGTVYWAYQGDVRLGGATAVIRQPFGRAATITWVPARDDGSSSIVEDLVPTVDGNRVFVSWGRSDYERYVGVINGTETRLTLLSTATPGSGYGPDNPYMGPPILWKIVGATDDGSFATGIGCVYVGQDARYPFGGWCPYPAESREVVFNVATATASVQDEPQGDAVSVLGFTSDGSGFAWYVKHISSDGSPDIESIETRVSSSTFKPVTVSGRTCYWPISDRYASHVGMLSPNGRYVFCNAGNPDGTYDFWRVDLETNTPIQISTGGPFDDGSLERPLNNSQGYRLRWVSADGRSAIFDVLSRIGNPSATLRWTAN